MNFHPHSIAVSTGMADHAVVLSLCDYAFWRERLVSNHTVDQLAGGSITVQPCSDFV